MRTKESEVNVSFILEGSFADLDEITDRLEVMPDRTRTLDDWPEAIKNPKNELPDYLKPRYVWGSSTNYEKCRLVRTRFEEMLKMLRGKEAIINELKEKYALKASFTVGVQALHNPCDMPEMFLTQEIIAFVASIGADIGFSMCLD